MTLFFRGIRISISPSSSLSPFIFADLKKALISWLCFFGIFSFLILMLVYLLRFWTVWRRRRWVKTVLFLLQNMRLFLLHLKSMRLFLSKNISILISWTSKLRHRYTVLSRKLYEVYKPLSDWKKWINGGSNFRPDKEPKIVRGWV